MAKYYGEIGFAKQIETSPGVWEEIVTIKNYSGDIIKNSRRNQSSEKTNDDITVSNEISILSDPFVNENFSYICFVEFMGSKWKIKSVEVIYPRLILSIGGVYNGK